jgi:hypothetical protein
MICQTEYQRHKVITMHRQQKIDNNSSRERQEERGWGGGLLVENTFVLCVHVHACVRVCVCVCVCVSE